jgi:secreted PhoX family phosphatase
MIRDGGTVFFASTDGGTRHCGQIWRYTPSPDEGRPGESSRPGVLELFLEPNDADAFENGDNLTMAPWGDLIACEDSPGANHILGITPKGRVYKIARLRRHEFSGATFSPDGTTLFVNVQKAGRTLAITGPWSALRRV